MLTHNIAIKNKIKIIVFFKALEIYLAESILLAIDPGAFESVIILPIVSAKTVLVVIGVGPDEDLTCLCRIVTPSPVEVIIFKCSFIKVAVFENLEEKIINMILQCNKLNAYGFCDIFC